MFVVWMNIDERRYHYATYHDRDKANEIALELRDKRNIDAYVVEINF